ncbi:S-layer homology domain-containing protein [Leptolyngbya sp. FACHB-261]|uniref:S-layer homology domain-containing protein n=1 Tax=Leptolyngbya sp. FACHB-261 TaxID=2692806 RepID=UPI0016834FF6|nr:S-layer homology domain-containing protein [Leptolyngbya sp. FACHB-261]MBD2102789.1 S-layer homology domain-containing protein [Leptolyngbya sp. FACHB-261]
MRKPNSGLAWLTTLGLTSSLFATTVISPVLLSPTPAVAQQASSFSDIQGHWAQSYIQTLASRGIISGFPNGTFGPSQPVTRAQFAAIVTKAFNTPSQRAASGFGDVPGSYWARTAIQQAYSTGFMSGYPNGSFQPEQNIPRVQVLVSLANGLNLTRNASSTNLSSVYQDAGQIPDYARDAVSAATQNRIVVNYPNVNTLNPNQFATRADVAAFVYQALVSNGQLQPIASAYVVNGNAQASGNTGTNTGSNTGNNQGNNQGNGQFNLEASTVQSGAKLPVRYTAAQRILIAPNETAPLTLTIAEDIRGLGGQVSIPRGSEVRGQLRPAEGGSQFVASELVLPTGQRFSLNARSAVVQDVKDPRDTSIGAILGDAAIGSAAAAIISGTVGDRQIRAERVLGGAVAGTVIGNVTADRVVVINPEQDLDLTLQSDLVLR